MVQFNRTSITPNNSGSTVSGSTSNINNYVFIDEFGNVTQIKKSSKERLKYYIDPVILETIPPGCVIGISGSNTSCNEGIGLGVGDNYFAYANYTL